MIEDDKVSLNELGDDAETEARRIAAPWMREHPHLFIGKVEDNFGLTVAAALKGLPQNGHVVAIVESSPDSISRIPGAWTVLHCKLTGSPSSVVVARRHEDIAALGRPLEIALPDTWPIGDAMAHKPAINALEAIYGKVRLHLHREHPGVFPGAAGDYDRQFPYDGVFKSYAHTSDISQHFRWKIHFYRVFVHMMKRHGWLPESVEETMQLDPYIVSDEDVARSREIVPWEDGTFVAITPTSVEWTRNWGPGRWARVVEWLSNKGVKVVVLGRDKIDLRCHENLYPAEVIDLTGENCPDIQSSAGVIRRCKVFASVDTGTAHIAASFGIPTVVASGPTVADTVFKPPAVGVYAKSPHKCFGCFQRNARYSSCNGKIDCMAALPTLKVAETIGELCGIPVEQNTVSICMIVKNEMKTLPECLESVKGFADEIVVVDTGSTDGTRKWIAERPWIRDFEFDVGEKIQSFSEARNVSLSHATSKYILWLDAVERLMDPKRLKTIVESQIADVYTMTIFHGTARYVREKIVPRVFARFTDRVHEFIPTFGLMDAKIPEGACVMRKIVDKVGREGSCERNIRLEKMMLEESPIDHPRRARWLYYVGRDLLDSGHIDEGAEYLKQRVNLVGFVEERVCAAVLLSRIYLYQNKEFKKAAELAEMMMKLQPNWREGYYVRGESLYWASKYEDAKYWYERCLGIKRPIATMWLWDSIYEWLVYDRLSRVCEYTGNTDGAITYAMQELKHAPASEHQWMSERLKKLSGVPTLT